jgi:hypothetical protein
MRGVVPLLSAVLLSSVALAPAHAGGWQAKRKGHVCFAQLTPSASRNAPPDRGKAYLAITANQDENSYDALTFTSGYPDVSKSVPSVKIGDKTFDLLPYKGAAFARSGKPEQDLVAAMLETPSMQVWWRSADGKTLIVDEYTLDGIKIARDVIDKACEREATQARAAAQEAQAQAQPASTPAAAPAVPRGNPFK